MNRLKKLTPDLFLLSILLCWMFVPEALSCFLKANSLAAISSRFTFKNNIPEVQFSPSSIVFGPDFSIGKHFNLTINLKQLDSTYNLTGFEFRIIFNSSLISVVSAYEGDIKNFSNKDHGTFFMCSLENESSLYLRNFLLPNTAGEWEAFPEGNLTLVIVEFKTLIQDSDTLYNGEFSLDRICLYDKQGEDIPFIPPQNATYTMLPYEQPERFIDLYMQYPIPYGGQGFNEPADVVAPAQLVTLHADAAFCEKPLSDILVTFRIYDNNESLYATLYNTTNENGHASVTFRMPWPDVNPERFIGIWCIVAFAEISGQVVNDTMRYNYEFLVSISNLTTDKDEYAHCENVEITVKYSTSLKREINAILEVVIHDELLVPIGYFEIVLKIGGTACCQQKNYNTVRLLVPYYAYSGLATISSAFLDISRIRISPEVTETIYILPL